MPVTPRFSWEEDAASIALHVTLPGTALKHVDLYISDLVVKVNAAPYVLLLDLFDLVDEASAVVKRNAVTHVVHISIAKKEAKMWHALSLKDSKAALRARRAASMERKSQSEAALAEKRKDRKHVEEKQTLRAQMAVDDTNRQILSDLKAEEKEREESAMYASFQELQRKQHQQQSTTSGKGAVSTAIKIKSKPKVGSVDNQASHTLAPSASLTLNSDSILKREGSTSQTDKRSRKSVSFAGDATTSNQGRGEEGEPVLELNADGSFDVVPALSTKPIWTQDTIESDDDVSDVESGGAEDESDNQAEPKYSQPPPDDSEVAMTKSEATDGDDELVIEAVELPPPRSAAQSEIQFTPRLFPTPSRESKAAEEEDWLLKNRKHLSKHKGLRGVSSTYDISESDPAWLKAKGDDFYRSRDYRSAVNAYSESLVVATEDQSDLLLTCLSNRAACNLQLAEFDKCMNDCSRALSLIPDTPVKQSHENLHVIKHYRLKLKLLVRRGTALCRLSKFAEAKADYGVALTMDSQNPALQQDYFQLMQLDKSQQAKERGDEQFRLNALDAAIEQYDQSLQLNPHSIACLSNRAACFLRMHKLQQCVDDCSRALELLQQQPREYPSDGTGSGIAFFSVGPAPGTAKRRAWVIKTMVRRGTAFVAMDKLNDAERDYAVAVELDPTNTTLQTDLAKIRQQLHIKAADPANSTTYNADTRCDVHFPSATSGIAVP